MCNNWRCAHSSEHRLDNKDSMKPRGRFRRLQEGFTLLELIAAMGILILLSSAALPLARMQVVRSREAELRRDLREMRDAIDRYKYYSTCGFFINKTDSFGYPPDLQSLVEGVPFTANPNVKYKFLRRIPVDPMTGSKDWGVRAMQDDPDSRSWGGQNVFDVYSKSDRTALDGTQYADW